MQRVVVSLVILLLAVMYAITPPPQRLSFLNQLEYHAYDIRLNLSLPLSKSEDAIASDAVVVVDIDELSQQYPEFGLWPWRRDITAQLIATLTEHYRAQIVGLDIYFPFHGSCSASEDATLQQVLADYRPVMAVKLELLKALGDGSGTSLREREDITGSGVQLWPEEKVGESAWPVTFPQAQAYSGNLSKFVGVGQVIGHITPVADQEDSNIRRLKAIYQYEQQYFDTLSLAMWRDMWAAHGWLVDDSLDHWFDSPKLRLAVDGEALPRESEGFPLGGVSVPINRDGEVLVPYFHSFVKISAAEILKKKPEEGLLEGRYVLIGSSAQAQGDDRVATPIDKVLPGVEIHAAMLNALGDPDINFKTQPYWEPLIQTILLIIIGLILLSASFFGVWASILVGPLFLITWFGMNFSLWYVEDIALEVLPPVLLISILAAYLVLENFLEINARHSHVRKLFSFYLPEEVVHRLASDRKGSDWLKPERKDMTVLFADVQGFTKMADSLPPEDVAVITHELFTALTAVIHHHGGTVDKYMGDAVMAFWGAPLDDEHHALNAALAAIDMQNTVWQMNQDFFIKKNIKIRLGIGINSGSILVGNLGSVQRHAYTVIGAVVNAASAIQQLTRFYEHDILVGEDTVRQIPESMSVDLGFATTKKLPHKFRLYAVQGATVE